MKKMLLLLDKAIRALTNIATWIAGICILLIVFMVSYEVFMRGFFNSPTEWTLEISGYLVIVSGFMGLAAALAADKHIKVDLLTSYLPSKVNRILGVFVSFAGLLFCYLLFVYGFDMMASSYTIGRTSTSTLRIPLYLPQIAVPLGALLITLEFIRKIIKDIYALFTIKNCN